MTEAASTPALGVSFTVNVPGDRNLVFQTHLAQTDTVEQVNAVIDRIMAVSDRLVAKYTVPLLEAQLEVETAQLARIKDDLERVDKLHADRAKTHADTRRGTYKVDPKETQQREQVVAMYKTYAEKVDKLKKQLDECRTKADGAH